MVGYYDLPYHKDKILKEISCFYKSITFEIKDCVVVGIGGSSLGTKAINSMLKQKNSEVKLHFLDSIDFICIDNVFSNIDIKKTLFIVISKSGLTLETVAIGKYLISRVSKFLKGEKLKKRFCFITAKNSKLDKFANSLSIKSFHIDKNIPGRFSVLSIVGLLPLYIAKFDIESLLYGAKKMFDDFYCDNTIIKKAYFYAKNYKKYTANVLFSYSSMFVDFHRWYIQLWAESLGKIDKVGKRVGLTPIGLIGTDDQHSFLQLILDGPLNKTVTFIKIKNSLTREIPNIHLKYFNEASFLNGKTFQELLNKNCDDTARELHKRGVPVDVIEISKIDEFSIGYTIFYFELLTSLSGILLGVNTYNQPSVDFIKKNFICNNN